MITADDDAGGLMYRAGFGWTKQTRRCGSRSDTGSLVGCCYWILASGNKMIIFLIAKNGTTQLCTDIGGPEGDGRRASLGWIWDCGGFGVSPEKFLKFCVQFGEFRCICDPPNAPGVSV